MGVRFEGLNEDVLGSAVSVASLCELCRLRYAAIMKIDYCLDNSEKRGVHPYNLSSGKAGHVCIR